MNENFKTKTYAKCILAGEHAVLQNYSLIAKSINSLSLELKYEDTNQPINLETTPSCPLSHENLMMYFYALMKNALKKVKKEFNTINGTFYLDTNIPISAGLGFSAAICIAVTDWIIWKGWLPSQNRFFYARELEDMFHGKSSGADIAACMSEDIIIFKKPHSLIYLKPTWKPNIYITTSNTISVTSEAVEKVQAFRNEHKTLGENTDKKMDHAVNQIINALKNNYPDSTFELIKAFNAASECFKTWDLIPAEVGELIKKLQQSCALAVKPTGAGNGGSILSLWACPPPASLSKLLTPIF